MKIQSLPNFVPDFKALSKGNAGKDNTIGDAIDKLTLSPLQIGANVLDASMGLAYTSRSFPQPFQVAGYVVGAAHGAMAVGYLLGCVDQSAEVAHSRVAKSLGHALLCAGHLAGAAGVGWPALAPIVGGMVAGTLQDYRDRTS